MKKNLTKQTTQEDLLRARKEGLEQWREQTSMKAHGKVYGMDTFSWLNPPTEGLINVISSFPFSVLWLSGYAQAKEGLELNLGLHRNLNTMIIYDQTQLSIAPEFLSEVETIMNVKSVNDALAFVKEVNRDKMVFLFTSHGDNARTEMNAFEIWLSENK